MDQQTVKDVADEVEQRGLAIVTLNHPSHQNVMRAQTVAAAINGLAIGVGFTMLLVRADLICISEFTCLRCPFAGSETVSGFASPYLVPRMNGFQKAKEIFYFSKKVSALEAFQLNLISGVAAPKDLLVPAKNKH